LILTGMVRAAVVDGHILPQKELFSELTAEMCCNRIISMVTIEANCAADLQLDTSNRWR
jgi:hypothetical protein